MVRILEENGDKFWEVSSTTATNVYNLQRFWNKEMQTLVSCLATSLGNRQ